MVKSGITAILFGAMLVVLGMIPNLIAGAVAGLRNFWDYFYPPRGPDHTLPPDSYLSGELCLLVGGGVLMVAGLVALVTY
jgi:hypothetical protein